IINGIDQEKSSLLAAMVAAPRLATHFLLGIEGEVAIGNAGIKPWGDIREEIEGTLRKCHKNFRASRK
ncbi:hypothetical protein GW17_00058872, partial [Ensete ventricosum]